LEDNDIYAWTGVTSGYVQYSWHHQELWKGRAAANVFGNTTKQFNIWNTTPKQLANKDSMDEPLASF